MKGKEKSKKISTDDLAILINRGFEQAETRINNVESGLISRINGVEERLSSKIGGLERRIDDLALNRATRDELTVLDKRVGRIETKLGLDFKKSEHA